MLFEISSRTIRSWPLLVLVVAALILPERCVVEGVGAVWNAQLHMAFRKMRIRRA